MLLLPVHLKGAREQDDENLLELGVVVDLAADVANEPAWADAQKRQVTALARSLFDMGVIPTCIE